LRDGTTRYERKKERGERKRTGKQGQTINSAQKTVTSEEGNEMHRYSGE